MADRACTRRLAKVHESWEGRAQEREAALRWSKQGMNLVGECTHGCHERMLANPGGRRAPAVPVPLKPAFHGAEISLNDYKKDTVAMGSGFFLTSHGAPI